MKIKLAFLISCFILITNCSLDSSSSSSEEEVTYIEQWHLIEVTGGIAGISDQFDLNTIIWVFDGSNDSLTITNNNDDDTKEDFLESGIYNYSQDELSGNSYLSINGTEYGQLELFTNGFTLDGTLLSSGPVSDGFLFSFQRVHIIED
ncbi:hypothetical protein N1F78_01650 [Seonamhaeicola sp. MEBiC1930]|uniref:hypothetical protein n=1 Tax=Seonamhaeicola sp. MEBiC01930 TaxID=2976768 RepID=UPI0032547BC3